MSKNKIWPENVAQRTSLFDGSIKKDKGGEALPPERE